MKYAINQYGGWRGIIDEQHLKPEETISEYPLPPKPSELHIYTGIISTDSSICWRLKTQHEQEIDKDNSVEGIDKFDKLWFEVTFNQENRLRTSDGQPTITRAQYRDALKVIYRGL